VKQFAVLATLSALSLATHASLEGSLSGVDLVTELLVHHSALRAGMAALLVAARVFLVFVAPAWAFAALAVRLAD
jgi:hypothetical protein